MLNSWIESVIIKRAILAIAAGLTSILVAKIIPDITPTIQYLQTIGLTITVIIDQDKFRRFLELLLFGASQGLHEWLAAKYPEAGKYI